MMFHVWTHLMCGSPSEAGGDSKNYLETSSICPQCLHAFPTPRDMQLHYSNVHGDHPSEVTCNICELTVDPAVHTSLHGDDDAPYHCRKCRYRTSIRTHLLDHFVRFHSNTRSLLCPFCLSSFSVGSNSSNSSVVTCTQFVGHMRQHRTIKNIRCCCCALKFVRQFDRKAHKKDHTKKNPKWISKPYTKHQRRKVGRKVWPASDSHRCLECAEVVDDLQEHTRQIRTCARCEYSTACDDEYMHHKGVQCTKRRSGFTRSRLLRCCVICTKCGRKSADPESIFPHLMKCSEGSAIVHDADREPIDERAAAREQQEIEHFALRERDLLADDGWLPAAAKAEREQNLPDSIKRVNVMLNSITDYEHFLEASKRKLACVEEEVLAEELNDVLLCMDGFDPEIA
ncbi:unnamed protein product [Toxocara canis]|uniref:C2H2-type domain-containing protein n=1 Tax=Toxocara canis TaxID=6265 RepID=A0A3P7ICX3_TOXCA|nr:unnamed protein product [Toxocara canis]